MPRTSAADPSQPPAPTPLLAAPWLHVAAIALLLCTPLLLVAMPPLTDLPNHMVRMMLLAGQLNGSPFASHYRVHWVFVPNLGMDLLVPPLLHVMPPTAAAKLLVAFVVAGWVGGLGLLGRALHGRWSPWFLTAAFTAWNFALLFGFMNYCLSAMLAFWATGAWLLLRGRTVSPRALAGLSVLALPLGFVLFVVHLFGAFIFAAFLGADALVRAWAARAQAPGRASRLAAALLPPLPAAAMLGGLYAATRVLTVGGRTFPEKPSLLWHTVSSAWFSYPVLLGAATGVLLTLVLVAAARAGRVAVSPAGLVVLLAAIVLGLAMPFAEHGLYYVNVRFQILAGVLASVVFLPAFARPRAGRLAAAALGAMFIVRLAIMLLAWSRTGPYLRDARWILDQVPPQTRLAAVDAQQKPRGLTPWVIDGHWPTDYHLPVYLAAISGRFMPALFDAPGQQPLEPTQEEAATEQAQRILTRAFGGQNPRGDLRAALRHFDAILVTSLWRHAPATLLHGHLALIAARPGIGLYKVLAAPPP